jgi:ATP-binding cassette subfamily G (WHITE) protein 2
MRIAPMAVFGALAYPALGFQPEWGHFAWFQLVLVSTAVASGALCYFVSSAVGVFALANLVVTVCYVVMMLFGGLLVNLDTLPAALHWLQYFSIFKQGYSALAITELHGLKFELAPFVSISGDKYLEEQGFATQDRPRNVGLLLASAGLYLFLAYVCLLRLRKE